MLLWFGADNHKLTSMCSAVLVCVVCQCVDGWPATNDGCGPDVMPRYAHPYSSSSNVSSLLSETNLRWACGCNTGQFVYAHVPLTKSFSLSIMVVLLEYFKYLASHNSVSLWLCSRMAYSKRSLLSAWMLLSWHCIKIWTLNVNDKIYHYLLDENSNV